MLINVIFFNQAVSVFVVLLLFASCAHADIIKVKNGGKIKGIVQQEGDDKIIVEIKFGHMALSKDDIEFIQRASEIENDSLKEKWEKEKKTKSPSENQNKDIVKTGADKSTSASSTPQKSQTYKKDKEAQYPKQVPMDRPLLVRCDDNIHSYAAFLPVDSDKRKCPVLFVFDPGGDGATAVRRFAFAVRDYGWIVIGSMDARNGPWENILSAQAAMLRDVKTRYNVEQAQYYAAGFSGGARMSYAIAYDNPSNFKGIIGCGAGYCSVLVGGRKILKNIAVYHCVGQSDDGARKEINKAFAALKDKGVSTYMNVFSGGHDWPPEHVLKQAVKWLTSIK